MRVSAVAELVCLLWVLLVLPIGVLFVAVAEASCCPRTYISSNSDFYCIVTYLYVFDLRDLVHRVGY